MRVCCIKERVFDNGKRYCYDWVDEVLSIPQPFTEEHYDYIDYYTYFYTQEAAQNYIRENKVA